MLADLRVEQIAAQRLEARHGAHLVPFHQSVVARDIGRQNGRELALDPLCAQGALPGGGGERLSRRLVSTIALCASAGGGSSRSTPPVASPKMGNSEAGHSGERDGEGRGMSLRTVAGDHV